MVKKMAIALLCTVLGSTLYADSKPFLGLEIGYATVQGDIGGFFPSDIIRDHDGSDVEYGIRLGAQSEEWRATLGYNYFDTNSDDNEQNYEKVLVSFDYFFLNAEELKLKPYIGANIGYVNYESTNNIDMSGVLYGAQAGVVFDVTENIDLDLMYRYSLSSATQNDRDASLDHIGSIVFGLNYIY